MKSADFYLCMRVCGYKKNSFDVSVNVDDDDGQFALYADMVFFSYFGI